MQKDIILVSGTVVEGCCVASGPSKVYLYGTLERQKPFFKKGGLDLERFFCDTLDVSITPLRFEMVKPAYTIRKILWTDPHPPKDFSFYLARLGFKEANTKVMSIIPTRRRSFATSRTLPWSRRSLEKFLG